MTTMLSINLPDPLAKASQEAAAKIGISRTAFIRQAITHEITLLHARLEEEAIIKSMKAMKQSKQYLKEANDSMRSLEINLPKDKEKWWRK
ncbi:MAG: hypothetical protein A3F43_06015 [Gammaproteobacteria bacterium RIFCSPHIGHO2_12_FULL_42_10]|nr:MAG: hypothetical protein A3F43_06015 [Gammaproteobacteria bacterium RIFCSPHIGHO2_12_FULL_42_10]